MKTHHLFLALTIGAFGISATNPWLVMSQPTQIAQAAQINDDSGTQTDPLTAQSVAAQVTVQIRVGEGLGSGVLLGKKGNTYLVLTNAHVLREKARSTIQTPDGQSYTARKVKDLQVGNFDVALLEFTSSRTYKLAKSDISDKDEFALKEGKPIFAAGFAHDSNALKFVRGEVKQLPQEPFVNGSQVGYMTRGDIEQGMSGGPILDESGNLVGINTTYAYPIKPVYTYADGTKAPPDKVKEYRQVNWGVPIYNLLTRLNPDILYSYKQLPKLHRTITPSGYMAELDRKARLVTVRIENSSGHGSGVIVGSDGNSFYVLTAEHVVINIKTKPKNLYVNQKIVTHDQRTYTIDPSDIKRSEGTDLAVVKFTTTQRYQVATLGKYNVLDGAVVFSGGWPAPKSIGSQQWQWQLNPGNVKASISSDYGGFLVQDKQSFSQGYDLLYNNMTYAGMSGGAIFDRRGQVIAIHGKAEGERSTGRGIVIGNSLGISIKAFLNITDKLCPSIQSKQIVSTAPVALNKIELASVNQVRDNLSIPQNDDITEWIQYGNQLYRLGKNDDAVKAFDKAIALDPNSLAAHYGKGLALDSKSDRDTKDRLASVKAFEQAIKLIPSGYEYKYYYLFKYHAWALLGLGEYSKSLGSISKAVDLEPNDPDLLRYKSIILLTNKQRAEGIKVLDIMIAKKPTSSNYRFRAVIRYAIGDEKGMISDYKAIVNLNPKSSDAYNDLASAKRRTGDNKGAIIDYNIAIRLDPKYIAAYNGRGLAKNALGDVKGAIADFMAAINIDPKYHYPYYNLANIKHKAGDYKGALADFNIAIELAPKEADTYNNRGITKESLGDMKGAIDDYMMAIKLDPKLRYPYYNIADIKKKEGDNRGAITYYDMAIKLDSKYVSAYNGRGVAKNALGDVKGAIADFMSAIKIDPKNHYSYHKLANTKYKAGDYKGAIADFNIAIELDPKEADTYNDRGITKGLLGDTEGAIDDYMMAIKLDPKSQYPYYNLARIKNKKGDNRGAITYYDIAIGLDPKYIIAYNYRGLTKHTIGDLKGAIEDYDTAIKLDSAFANAYRNRGLTKYTLGDTKGGITDLSIAAQLYKDRNDRPSYEEVVKLIQKLSS